MSSIPDDVRVAVIVVAAGSGTRLQRERPKAFVEVGGATILEHALRGVFRMSRPAQVIVVAPQELLEEAATIGRRVAGSASGYLSVVPGGATRQASVDAGLATIGDAIERVLVHDAARALTPSSLFDTVDREVERRGHGVIPALPMIDTVKRVEGDRIIAAVDRSELVQVQTPQGFPRADLTTSYRLAGDDHTDDAALVQANGFSVSTVPGEATAFKITTPWDLGRAEQLLAPAAASAPAAPAPTRSGLGIDAHRYDPDAPMWLGGLLFADEPGLAGHSDGDAVLHALCDALLSAAGLGDIGSRFGTADPRFAGAASEVFVREALALVADAGFALVHAAVQVVGNRPRLAARRHEMEAHLAELLGAPVSVSATTTDGLGFTGRGEGLTAIATALLAAHETVRQSPVR